MAVERPKWLKHGTYRFNDWSIPDPDDEKLAEALHRARYDLAHLTQDEAYRILSAAEAYVHLAGHPANNANIMDQLRAVRWAVRKARKGEGASG